MATQRARPGKAGQPKPQPARRPPQPEGARAKAQRRQQASRALAAARGGRSSRQRLWLSLGSVGLVLAVIAVLVIVKLATGSGAPKSGQAAGLAPTSLVLALASVPDATLNAVGAGTAGQKPFVSLPTKTTGAALTAGGLPRVLYVGADYCPYCAAERWAIAVALSRFGDFHHLGTTSSSPSDVYPNTATLSFHGAGLTSTQIAFNGYEIYSNQALGAGYTPLDTLHAADKALFEASGGSFPYLNIGGRYVISGASYNPQLLHGLTRAQIAAAISDPASPIAKAVDGTANVITAALCDVTNGKPASVCTSPGVEAGRAKIGS
jgi:hypothetical protein